MLSEIIAFWLYRFEVNVRAAAVLGVVGAGGIGSLLSQTLSYGKYSKSGMIVIIIVVATLVIDAISDRLRRRVIDGPGTARPTAGAGAGRPRIAACRSGHDPSAAPGVID